VEDKLTMGKSEKKRFKNAHQQAKLRGDNNGTDSKGLVFHHPANVGKSSNGSESEERKLSKQERRNRNKLLKAAQNKESSIIPVSKEDSIGDKVPVPSTSVYKRQNIFPESYYSQRLSQLTNLISKSDPEFNSIVDTSYKGFCVDTPADFPSSSFSQEFKSALQELDTLHYYQFDFTQPAGLGTKVARTFVTRCLVGDPGITYKYLGLRMFSYPWTSNTLGSNSATVAIGKLNQELIQRSRCLNDQSGKSEYGSCNFNLTLINRCFPEDYGTIKLKMEPMFEKELFSVSWHADSSLDHYSTIGVYHFNLPLENSVATTKEFKNNGKKEKGKDKESNASSKSTPDQSKAWKIALRVTGNAEGPFQGKPVPENVTVSAPPLMIELPEECVYYMLDDFNHHHQHAG
jgi:hypothetical protein